MKFAKAALFWLGLVATCSQGIAQTDENKDNKIVFQDGSTYDNDFRVWSTAEGEFTVVAKFHSFLDANIVRLIRKDTGKVIDVRISILAPDDRDLLEKIRKDVALKLIPKDKQSALDQYKLGIEELFTLEKDYREKTSAINNAEDLLSVKKDNKLEAAEKVYKRKLTSVEINLHLLIDDVKDIGGRLSVEGPFALVSDDGAGLEVSNVSLLKSDDTLAMLKKGEVIRLACKVSPRINGTSTATVKMIDQTFDLVITEISTLSEMDKKVLPNAKVWYEDIAKAINAARLDPSAPLVKKHLPQLPTLATLQRIVSMAKISDADIKKFDDYFSGLPELMSDIERIRNTYLDDIANSDNKDDLNGDEYAAYERVVWGIKNDCRKQLIGKTISVPICGYTYHDLRYGTIFRPSLPPGPSGGYSDMNAWDVDRYLREWRQGWRSSVLNKQRPQKFPPVVQLLERLFDKFPGSDKYGGSSKNIRFHVARELKKPSLDEGILKKIDGKAGLFKCRCKLISCNVGYSRSSDKGVSIKMYPFFTTKYEQWVGLGLEFMVLDIVPVNTIESPADQKQASDNMRDLVPLKVYSTGVIPLLTRLWARVYPAGAF